MTKTVGLLDALAEWVPQTLKPDLEQVVAVFREALQLGERLGWMFDSPLVDEFKSSLVRSDGPHAGFVDALSNITIALESSCRG